MVLHVFVTAVAIAMHDLNELAAFVSVMKSGNLSLSARELGVSKSTLSRRIGQLERRLEQPLLRRQANRLLPTEAGTLFHRYCQQILRLADQSHQALDDIKEAVSGELVVDVHGAFMRGWFARRAEEFLARFPGVRLALRTQCRPPDGPEETSLCLWLGEVGECGLRQETLGYLSRGIYAHPDYLARHGVPEHPRELASHAWVDLLGDTGEGLQLQHEREGVVDVTPPLSRLRVDQYVLHIDALARGQGLGVLPNWMVENFLAAHPGSLTRCLDAWRPSPLAITLLYPFGRLPRRIDSLLTHLRQSVPGAWQRSPGLALSAD